MKKSIRLTAALLLILSIGKAQIPRPSAGFALLVGVKKTTAPARPGSSYPDDATKGSAFDAQCFAAALKERGFKPENITVLTTPEETKADSILSTLRLLVQKASQTRDFVFFYFSGHGDQVPDQPPYDEIDGADEVLIASDKAIRDDDLRSAWTQFAPGVKLIMLVDACHSGTTFGIMDFAHKPTPAGFHGIWANETRLRKIVEAEEEWRTRMRTTNTPITHPEPPFIRINRSQRGSELRPDSVRFFVEYGFDKSAHSEDNCISIFRQPTEPYQMVYIGACYDKGTIPGGDEKGSPFTQKLLFFLSPNSPARGTVSSYREWCRYVADNCPASISYAELGPVSREFITNPPFYFDTK
jgi:hypothetical protein